ncbi:MAG: hypothetical protein AAB836_02205 [Patescibacteria group bacterium]
MTDQIPTRIPSHISYDLPGAQDGDGSEDNCFEMPEALEEVDQVFSKPAEAPLPANTGERVRSWFMRTFGM